MTASFGRFFLPGPTEVLPEILAAQLKPMIGHRGKGMEELIARIEPPLKRVFRTERPVYISSSSATGFMEAAIRNGVRERVLCLTNGAFSERFFQIAQKCGVAADALAVEWGEAHDPARVADALKGGKYDAITVVHSETSTGVLNDVAAITRVAHDAGDVVALVDGVTSVAGSPVETDAWKLDFVLTGSQKAFALPPGLAFAVARESFLAKAKVLPNRGAYFDLLEFENSVHKNQTPNTPALPLIYALAEQLTRIDKETIEARWARHAAMAERTARWVDEMKGRGVAIRILAPEGHRSATNTCIVMPPDKKGSEVTAAMKTRGFVIGAGYGKMKDTSIRIGHMGDHTVAELDVLLGALAELLT